MTWFSCRGTYMRADQIVEFRGPAFFYSDGAWSIEVVGITRSHTFFFENKETAQKKIDELIALVATESKETQS